MELAKTIMSEHGLKENKAKEIESLYIPMITMLSEMEAEYNDLVSKEITKELSLDAKNLRIRISKVRINAEKAKTTAKAEYLRAGNAIQGAYNTLKYVVESKEEKLKAIETHSENLEKERIEKLQEKRYPEVEKYIQMEVLIPDNLGKMDTDVYKNYLTGLKASYDLRIEAEKKAEQDRLAKEKAEKAEQERIKKENEQLKKQAEEKERLAKIEREKIEKEREFERKKQAAILEKQRKEAEEKARIKEKRNNELRPYIVFIRDYSSLLNSNEDDYKKQFSDIKKGAELQWEHDRKEVQKQAKKEQKEHEERVKIEAELKAKQEKELKVKQEKESAEKKARLAPDKDKLIKLSHDIINLEMPDLSSDEAKRILTNVKGLLIKVDDYIKEKYNNL